MPRKSPMKLHGQQKRHLKKPSSNNFCFCHCCFYFQYILRLHHRLWEEVSAYPPLGTYSIPGRLHPALRLFSQKWSFELLPFFGVLLLCREQVCTLFVLIAGYKAMILDPNSIVILTTGCEENPGVNQKGVETGTTPVQEEIADCGLVSGVCPYQESISKWVPSLNVQLNFCPHWCITDDGKTKR